MTYADDFDKCVRQKPKGAPVGMVESREFYTKSGQPYAFETGGRVYRWDGHPLGYLAGDRIHDTSGKFVGWYSDGFVIDPKGLVCLFTTEADSKDFISLPRRQPRPAKGSRQPFGQVPEKNAPPKRPERQKRWGGNPF